MKVTRVALLAVLLAACPAANASPTVSRDDPKIYLTLADGDTAKPVFSYTAGARATGALRTIRVTSYPASSPAWVGLPTDNPGPAAGTYSGLVTNSAADSADFIACVKWTNSSGATAERCSSAVRWRRKPGQGTVTWDSVTAIRVLPDSAFGHAYLTTESPVNLTSTQIQFCPTVIFSNGAAAMPVGYSSITDCASKLATARTISGWGTPTANQQSFADNACWNMTTTNGTFIAPAKWQARRYTNTELPVATIKWEQIYAENIECGSLLPGTTVGIEKNIRGQIIASQLWLTRITA